MDGMGIVVTGANSLEMLQQIEVLNGLGGAIYGPANPSGMFNFVPKRPTERPFRQVTFGYDNQYVGTVHADVGGRLGSDRQFGYRANVLVGDGQAFVKNSDLTRRLASFAGDVRPFAKTTIEGLYSYYNVAQQGFPSWFTYGQANAGTASLAPPDARIRLVKAADRPQPDGPALAHRRVAPQAGHQHFGVTTGIRTSAPTHQHRSTRSRAAPGTGASLATGFAPRFYVSTTSRR